MNQSDTNQLGMHQSGQRQTCGLCDGRDFITIPPEEKVAAYYTQDDQKASRGESSPSPRRIMRAWNNSQHTLKQVDLWKC